MLEDTLAIASGSEYDISMLEIFLQFSD